MAKQLSSKARKNNAVNITISKAAFLASLKLYSLLPKIFALLFFSFIALLPVAFHFFPYTEGSSFLAWSYILVLIMLAVLMLKRLFGISALPMVPYDVLLLTFTSIVTIATLQATLSGESTASILGGNSLKSISALSLIIYWFIYYLVITYFANKKRENRLTKILALGLLLPLLLNLLTGLPLLQGILEALLLTSSLWAWLFLTQRSRWIYAPVLLLSLIAWFIAAPKEFGVIALIVNVIMLVIIGIKNRKNLRELVAIDKSIRQLVSKKITLGDFGYKYADLLMVLGYVVSIIAISIWFKSTNYTLPVEVIASKFKSVTALTGLKELLFGKGLLDLNLPFVFQFLYSYGWVSFGILVSVIVVWLLNVKRMLVKVKTPEILGIVWGLLTLITTIIVTSFVTKTGELFNLMSVILMSQVVVTSYVNLDKKEMPLDKKVKFKLNLLMAGKVILSILIIGLLIYLISIIPIIALYWTL